MVLEVPLDICIIRQLDASEAGIKIEGEMSVANRKQLCWILEFFLSVELMQSISEGGEEFWMEYRKYLPSQDTPFPLLFSKEELEELRQCDSSLARTVERHRERLSSAWREQLGRPAPEGLLWANALVLSRCFHVYSKTAVLGWLAPFVDMANHSPEAHNCSMTTSASSVQVVASRRIEAGEELLLCYAHFPSAHLFWRYGFVTADNEEDVVELPVGAPVLCRRRVGRFLDSLGPPPAGGGGEEQGSGAGGGGRERTLLSGLWQPLPGAAVTAAAVDGAEESDAGAEAEAARALMAALELERDACRRVSAEPHAAHAASAAGHNVVAAAPSTSPDPCSSSSAADDEEGRRRREGLRAYAAGRAVALEAALARLRGYCSWLEGGAGGPVL